MSDAWDGRPQNPERDGWHWASWRHGTPQASPAAWDARRSSWFAGINTFPANHAARAWRYIGPCLLPAEIAAREAAAAAAMREAAARRADDDGIGDDRDRALRAHLASCIAALPLPSADALAAALREAEKRGIERAAEWCKRAAEDAALSPDQGGQGNHARAFVLEDAHDAIRALLEDRA